MSVDLVVFHGTVWEPDEAFFRPDAGYSDFGVVYFSQGEEVARRFADSRAQSIADGLKVVLKGRLSLQAPAYFQGSARSPYHEVDGVEFDVARERESFFDALRAARHDAFIIPGNYGPGEHLDDIAALDDGLFECDEVAFCVDGRWTGFVPVEEAEERFESLLARPSEAEPPGPDDTFSP